MQTAHRVLVVGAGSIGERHLRCFRATGRAVVGFVEVKPELRQDVASRYHGAAAYESLEQALADGYTAAVVATPAPMHVSQATQLADAGLHLLIEKPLSLSLDGIDAMLGAVRARQLTAAVAYVYRAHPILSEMREAVVGGEFGRPLELVAVSGQHFPFYRPAYRDTYYARRETGGGAVQDALTHIINAAQWLVGSAQRVIADADHCLLPGVEVEDTVHVLARHGGVLASYSLNQHQAPNELTISVICQRGTARFEYHTSSWKSVIEPGQQWTVRAEVALERDTLFTQQANAFLDTIERRRPTLCSLEEGMDSVRITTAILKSIESRSWCDVKEAAHAFA
jgi:predicted dehydrogenase